jgi:hypothetical protein
MDFDQLWDCILDPAPPTTLEEGRCEARTLASWGTVPYVIVDDLFQSEHGYPLIERKYATSSERFIQSELDTLFCVESDYPFTLTIDGYLFSSTRKPSYDLKSTKYAVQFPDGLPLFRLLENTIAFRDETDSTRPGDDFTMVGEVYDATSPYMPVPNWIRITAPEYHSPIYMHNGRLTAVVPEITGVGECESGDADGASECESSDSDGASECESSDSDTDEDRPLSEYEVREYYASLPVRDFLKLGPDVQEAAIELLVTAPKSPTPRTKFAEQLTTVAFALENWTRTDPTGGQDEFVVYRDAIIQSLDNICKAL